MISFVETIFLLIVSIGCFGVVALIVYLLTIPFHKYFRGKKDDRLVSKLEYRHNRSGFER